MASKAGSTASQNLLSAKAIAKMPSYAQNEKNYGLASTSRSTVTVLRRFGLPTEPTKTKTEKEAIATSTATFYGWLKADPQINAFADYLRAVPSCMSVKTKDRFQPKDYFSNVVPMIKGNSPNNTQSDMHIHAGMFCTALLKGSDWNHKGKSDKDIQEVAEMPLIALLHILHKLKGTSECSSIRSFMQVLEEKHSDVHNAIVSAKNERATETKAQAAASREQSSASSETPPMDDSEPLDEGTGTARKRGRPQNSGENSGSNKAEGSTKKKAKAGTPEGKEEAPRKKVGARASREQSSASSKTQYMTEDSESLGDGPMEDDEPMDQGTGKEAASERDRPQRFGEKSGEPTKNHSQTNKGKGKEVSKEGDEDQNSRESDDGHNDAASILLSISKPDARDMVDAASVLCFLSMDDRFVRSALTAQQVREHTMDEKEAVREEKETLMSEFGL